MNPTLRVATAVLVVAATVVLIGALGKHSGYYYVMLRCLTFSAAVVLVWRGAVQGSLKWGYVFVPVAIVFNPIVPVHLHGKRLDVVNTWQTLDIVCAAVMVMAMILIEVAFLLKNKR